MLNKRFENKEMESIKKSYKYVFDFYDNLIEKLSIEILKNKGSQEYNYLKKFLNTKYIFNNFKISSETGILILYEICSKYNLNKYDYINVTDNETIFNFIDENKKDIGLNDLLNRQFLSQKFYITEATAKNVIIKYCEKNNLNSKFYLSLTAYNRSCSRNKIPYEKIFIFFDENEDKLNQILNVSFIQHEFKVRSDTTAYKIIKLYCERNNLKYEDYVKIKAVDYNKINDFLKSYLAEEKELKKVLNINFLVRNFDINKNTATKILDDFCLNYNLDNNKYKKLYIDYDKIYNFLVEHKKNHPENLDEILKITFLREKFDIGKNVAVNILLDFCIKNNLDYRDYQIYAGLYKQKQKVKITLTTKPQFLKLQELFLKDYIYLKNYDLPEIFKDKDEIKILYKSAIYNLKQQFPNLDEMQLKNSISIIGINEKWLKENCNPDEFEKIMSGKDTNFKMNLNIEDVKKPLKMTRKFIKVKDIDKFEK